MGTVFEGADYDTAAFTTVRVRVVVRTNPVEPLARGNLRYDKQRHLPERRPAHGEPRVLGIERPSRVAWARATAAYCLARPRSPIMYMKKKSASWTSSICCNTLPACAAMPDTFACERTDHALPEPPCFR